MVKCRISSPRAMMIVWGSLRLPKTVDCPVAFTGPSFRYRTNDVPITHR